MGNFDLSGNGWSFGGGSGLAGWGTDIGRAWATGIESGLSAANAFRDAQRRAYLEPSANNAIYAQQQAAIEQNQVAKTQAQATNLALNAFMQQFGPNARQLLTAQQGQVASQGVPAVPVTQVPQDRPQTPVTITQQQNPQITAINNGLNNSQGTNISPNTNQYINTYAGGK